MNRFATLSLILLAVVVWLGSMSIFVVDERELAVKFRLGEFEDVTYEPGLHFKIPFINTVRRFDRRVLTLDAEPERYLTYEKKNVIVDAFIKWRIADVQRFYKSTGGDERAAQMRLAQLIKDALRAEFGKRTIQEAISGERAEIMNVLAGQVADEVKQFGAKIIDVRIKRIELPPEVSDSVYQRMRAERARVAADLRSRGAEAAERIRADADRQRTVILAEAYRDAERIRGGGDAKAAEIYAKAFSRDENFYDLYRSLRAYKNVFGTEKDVLVLDPNSEFFRFFKDANGSGNSR